MTETPGAPAFDDWPANEQRKRERIARGMVAARLELAARSVAPPTDEKHADFYDPPLTLAEQRHRIHVMHGRAVETCRFCDPMTELTAEALEAAIAEEPA